MGIIAAYSVTTPIFMTQPQVTANTDRPSGCLKLAIILGLGTVVLVVAAPILIRSFVAEARFIPADSMAPTLKINDRVIINKAQYWSGAPQRGDIVVFNPTENLKSQGFKDAFIKRIVALPGETVAVINGQVMVNDKPLTEPYIQEKPNYDWGPEVVPAKAYFVLGDNRNNSYDSHYWGYVPRANIVGPATYRFWPSDRGGGISRPVYPAP
jgi:signal peptidase I